MGPQWLVEVPKVAATPAEATRIIEFMMQMETSLERAGIRNFELPVWLQPTPDGEKALEYGWETVRFTPKQFVDHFGEERFAACVAARAQNGAPPLQHLVFCPPLPTDIQPTPAPMTQWYSIPSPALIEPDVDVAKHAPLYLDSNLMPRDPYFWLPDFPRSRPNMLPNEPHARLPAYDPNKPVLYKNHEGIYLPYPEWYLPSQIELSDLPPAVLQKYTQALWRRQVLVTTGVQHKILEEAQCRICQQTLPLAEAFTKRVRHKYRIKTAYKPVCRDCMDMAHLLNLIPYPPDPPSSDSSVASSQDFMQQQENRTPAVL